MVSPPLVVGCRLQVLEKVRLEHVRADEVGGDDAEQPPTSLTGVGVGRLVVGGLFHQLAVHLVAQGLVLVAVLQKKGDNVRGCCRTEMSLEASPTRMLFTML
jgi:hypothetical protein